MMIFQVLIMLAKLVFKAVKFTGLYVCLVPILMSIALHEVGGYNNSVVTFLDEGNLYIFYVCLFVITPLITIQNVYRMMSKNPEFSIFKTILSFFQSGKKKGFEANLKKHKGQGMTSAITKPTGFVLGKDKGQFVTKSETEDGHILIIGGSGSGKSTCLAIPTLQTWVGRIFAIDIKGELQAKTAGQRKNNNFKVFNPNDASAFGYDPFFALEGARNLIAEINQISNAIVEVPKDSKNPFFAEQARVFLSGALLFYYDQGFDFSESIEHIKLDDKEKLIQKINQSDNLTVRKTMSDFKVNETFDSVISTLNNSITVFATDEDLLDALSTKTKNCITPYDLETHDIFIQIEEHMLEQYKPLLTMISNQFIKSFERRPNDNGKSILFLLDEFPRLGKIDSITNALSTLRSKSIHIALFVQSKSQLNMIYGKDTAEVIADNCNYKAILKATEPTTQKWCSDLVGTYDKLKKSHGANASAMGMHSGTSVNRSEEEKRIMKPEEFGYLKDDVVCIFPNGYKVLKKAPYYKEKNYKPVKAKKTVENTTNVETKKELVS